MKILRSVILAVLVVAGATTVRGDPDPELDPPAVRDLLIEVHRGSGAAEQALLAAGLSVLPALREGLVDSDLAVREGAMKCVARLGNIPDAEKELLAESIAVALHDSLGDLPASALYALGNLSPASRRAYSLLLDLEEEWDARMGSDAAMFLARGGEPVEPLLRESLIDRRPARRAAAARALGAIGRSSAESTAALLQALRDPVALVRHSAVMALGQQRTPDREVGLALAACLEDVDLGVRADAAASLERFRAAAVECLPALTTALADRDEIVRAAAAAAIGSVGTKGAGEADARRVVAGLTKILADPNESSFTRQAAARGLGGTGALAAPALAEACGDLEPAIARAALDSLGRLGPEGRAGARAVLRRLHQGPGELRSLAFKALVKIDPESPELLAELIAALQDPEPELRRQAASLLGDLGPSATAAVPALIDALADPDRAGGGCIPEYGVSTIAAQSLRHLAPAAPAAFVDAFEHHPNLAVRLEIASLWTHATTPPSGAAPVLLEALREGCPEIRGAAARALGNLAKSRPDLLPRLVRALEDPALRVRIAAAESLAAAGSAASAAVPFLLQGLESDEIAARVAFARCLAKVVARPPEALPPLLALLQDPEPRLRAEAARLLGSLGAVTPESQARLLALRSDPAAEVRVALAVSLAAGIAEPGAVVGALIGLLDDSDPGVRVGAADSLRLLGAAARAAVPALTERLVKEEPTIRSRMEWALSQIR